LKRTAKQALDLFIIYLFFYILKKLFFYLKLLF
jgi:hypothetical protein